MQSSGTREASGSPAAERPAGDGLRWPPDAKPDYVLPVAGILAFQFLVNRANRHFSDFSDDYAVSFDSIGRNLRRGWDTDSDRFTTNQLGHPYQGAMYHGFARSAGLGFWPSLGYTFAGSAVWEIAGENTRPSINDQVASGIGGSFLGEALFRMFSLLLEQGGGLPPFWRELAATAISPAAGANRWLFGRRDVFSSRDAPFFSRVQFGVGHDVKSNLGPSASDEGPNRLLADFLLDYGNPGSSNYAYTRPFDYFTFRATASSANILEEVMTRGLLVGSAYEVGTAYRGIWGLYGGFDYIRPQAFKVSTTALSLGTTMQWWVGPKLALQGSAMSGIGYAAVSTAGSRATDDETGQDYRYGVAPQASIALRLTHEDRTSLDLLARGFLVSDVASGGATGGRDSIVRIEASLTRRLVREHAIVLKAVGSWRDARFAASSSDFRQSHLTVGIYYALLGQDRFGVPDWR